MHWKIVKHALKIKDVKTLSYVKFCLKLQYCLELLENKPILCSKQIKILLLYYLYIKLPQYFQSLSYFQFIFGLRRTRTRKS